MSTRAGVAREHEHGREHGADARRRAHGERAAEQRARAAPARAGEQARRDDALRHRQQADEGEPEHDEHEARDLGLRVRRDGVADRRGAGAEHDEDDREAEDERQAREHDAARVPRSPSRPASTLESAER